MAFMQPTGLSNSLQWTSQSARRARTGDDPFEGATQKRKEPTFQPTLLKHCRDKARVLTNSNKTSNLSLKKQCRLPKSFSSVAY